MIFSFHKKSNREFFDLFQQSAENFGKAATVMGQLLQDYGQADERTDELLKLEGEADAVDERIIDKLNVTFITPMDREDILAMVEGLNSMISNEHGAMQRLVLYKVKEIRPGAVTLNDITIHASEALVEAFSLLHDVHGNETKIMDSIRKVYQLEAEADSVYRHEMGKIFDEEADVKELIKWKDVLEYQEETMDKCEHIADLIRGVVMKYA